MIKEKYDNYIFNQIVGLFTKQSRCNIIQNSRFWETNLNKGHDYLSLCKKTQIRTLGKLNEKL